MIVHPSPSQQTGCLALLAVLLLQVVATSDAAAAGTQRQGKRPDGKQAGTTRILMPSGLPAKVSRACSVMELARMMVPSNGGDRKEFSAKEMSLLG